MGFAPRARRYGPRRSSQASRSGIGHGIGQARAYGTRVQTPTPAFWKGGQNRGMPRVESSPRIRLGCSSPSLCIRLCIPIAVAVRPCQAYTIRFPFAPRAGGSRECKALRSPRIRPGLLRVRLAFAKCFRCNSEGNAKVNALGVPWEQCSGQGRGRFAWKLRSESLAKCLAELRIRLGDA
jgi:hypothetical protein